MDNYKELSEYILYNLNETHFSIATLIKKLYHNTYCVSTDNNKDKWFKYNGTHWESSSVIKHELKNKLSTEIAQIIVEARTRLRGQIINNENHSFELNRLKILFQIEKMLYNTNQKDSILKECESVMYTSTLPNLSN